MEQYLIDTNAVSHYFSASFSVEGMQFMDMVIDAVPNLSVITQIELLCWKIDAGTEQKVKAFIKDSVLKMLRVWKLLIQKNYRRYLFYIPGYK